jgi:hypothetical protein
MKRLFLFTLLAVLSFSLITACGGGGKSAVKDSSIEVIDDPFQDLTDLTSDIITGGGLAAVGQGTSERQDLAKKKAVTDAQGQLAEILEAKVNKMKKSFQEEIGTGSNTEINEAFTDVVKVLSKTTLRGAITKKTKFMKDKDTGMFTAAVVVAVEPNTINMSLFDEMQKSQPKLYERFRASQAYKELEDEMKNYDEN